MQQAKIISTPVQKLNPAPRPRVVYVCLMSQYTVASAQAIRVVKPDEVIAVTSKFAKDSTELFKNLLEQWGIHVTSIGADQDKPFPAESLQESADWMDKNLCPLLDQHKKEGTLFFANLAGSTKAASIALNSCWRWDERHYTAEGTRNVLNVDNHPSGTALFSVSPLDILEEARLLNPKVGRRISEPVCDNLGLRIEAANRIFDDYKQGRGISTLDRYGKNLEYLWFEKEKTSEELSRRGLRIEGKNAFVLDEELQAFLLALQDLDPNAVQRVGDAVRIPATRNHAWVKFLTGGWWELLVETWIQEHGALVESNIEIFREKLKTVDTETDLLVRLATGELGAIECKADVSTASGSIDIVKILNELSGQYGKTKAALAIGPAFW